MDATVEWKLRMAALRRLCGLPVQTRKEQGKDKEEDTGGEEGGGEGPSTSTSMETKPAKACRRQRTMRSRAHCLVLVVFFFAGIRVARLPSSPSIHPSIFLKVEEVEVL